MKVNFRRFFVTPLPMLGGRLAFMARDAPAADEEMLTDLEARIGRRLRTLGDVRAYLRELDAAVETRIAKRACFWATAKQVTWLVLLLFSFLQYHLIDVLLEIASLREMTVFVPVAPNSVRSSLELLARLI